MYIQETFRGKGLGVQDTGGSQSLPVTLTPSTQMVCLKIKIHEIHEIHKIYEIHMPKYRNPPTMYEIHRLKIEIHKGHESTQKRRWLNIEIHEIHKLYEIHIGKAVNKPTGNSYSINIMYIQ